MPEDFTSKEKEFKTVKDLPAIAYREHLRDPQVDYYISVKDESSKARLSIREKAASVSLKRLMASAHDIHHHDIRHMQPTDLTENRRVPKFRRLLAKALVVLLGAIIVIILGIHIRNINLLSTKEKDNVNFEASRDVAGQILSPLVTLATTAIGFYFGSKLGRDQ